MPLESLQCALSIRTAGSDSSAGREINASTVGRGVMGGPDVLWRIISVGAGVGVTTRVATGLASEHATTRTLMNAIHAACRHPQKPTGQ